MSTWNVKKRMEMRLNKIYIKQTLLSCMRTIFFFSINNKCQSTKLLKPDSSTDEP